MTDADSTTTTPIILTQPNQPEESMNTDPGIENGNQNGLPPASSHRVITQPFSPPTLTDQAFNTPASSQGRFFQENQKVTNLQIPADVYSGPTLPPPVIPEPVFWQVHMEDFHPKIVACLPNSCAQYSRGLGRLL